jgi:polysaccharide biosynthesis protein PslH
MKILFVVPRFPYPLTQGDRLLCYHRLRTLSKSHELTLVTLYQSPQELDYLPKILPFCQNIYPIYLPRWKSLSNCVEKWFLSRLPLQVAYYLLDSFQNEIDRIISIETFDIIHFLMLRTAEYQVDRCIPQIVEIVDSMQLNIQTRIPFESPLKRYLYREELSRLTSYENQLDRKFDKIVVCAEKDAKLLTLEPERVAIVPTGTDIELFTAKTVRHKNDETIDIVFTGKMSYPPNIHAARWFVTKCWNLLKHKLPDIRLTIAGADPPPEIIKFDRLPGIQVTGFVPSIVDILDRADIAITPMQSGSGMQSKVFEAMSCCLPVVTTSLGLGSVEAKIGEEILVADTPEEFVDTIIQLARDPHQRQQIGLKARAFVEANHSWETGAVKIEAIYEEVIAANSADRSIADLI